MLTFHGGASRATIEPDNDIVLASRVLGGEEPKEVLLLLTLGLRSIDGNETGVTLADIEVNVRDSRSINVKS